jgi:hypothetical protein
MEVQRLIVLVLSYSAKKAAQAEAMAEQHADDQRDGYALAVKFLDRRKASITANWQTVANGAGLEVAGHGAAQIGNKHAAIVVHSVDGKVRTESDVIKAFLKGADTCGFYILMHGMHGMALPNGAAGTFMSPGHVAKQIDSMCPQKIKLLKVNVVGCTLASKPSHGQGDETVRHAIKEAGSWAQALCAALHREDTMVAAYTEAVYVVRDKNPEFRTMGVDGDPYRPKESKLGQKAVNLGSMEDKKIEQVRAHRANVKRVFQYKKDQVIPVTLEKYSAYRT